MVRSGADREHARNLRDDYLDGRHELVAPALLPFEVTNALRYSRFRDEQRLAVAAESLGEYDLDLRPFARSDPVAETAVTLDISVWDASYVALAYAVDGQVYTADETFLEIASDTGHEDRGGGIADCG